MEINKTYNGDCSEILKTLPENSVDSIVTDPPYELGFMGKSWDNTGIANNKEMWAECLRVLKPGGYLLSFGGTRTYHRMAVAIEDAGFEVRDMIEWVYGSGFPKSLNIGKAVDKLQGNEREVVGTVRGVRGADGTGHEKAMPGKATGIKQVGIDLPLTKGTSEWEGWGTALKPAHEPICMARKPLAEKTVALNVLKYGTGGINIDESRVEGEMGADRALGKPRIDTDKYGKANPTLNPQSPLGRFPANLIHDNSEEVRECFPDSKSTGGTGAKSKGKMGTLNWEGQATGGFGDEGSASRFFKSIIYQAKASKSERNKGCEELSNKEVHRYGAGLGEGLTPEAPSIDKNNHPTVKPIALMEYLIKMVTPKGGVILDPFAGSGSTLVAAKQNGFQYIGIEMTAEYIPIIEARLNGTDNTLF